MAGWRCWRGCRLEKGLLCWVGRGTWRGELKKGLGRERRIRCWTYIFDVGRREWDTENGGEWTGFGWDGWRTVGIMSSCGEWRRVGRDVCRDKNGWRRWSQDRGEYPVVYGGEWKGQGIQHRGEQWGWDSAPTNQPTITTTTTPGSTVRRVMTGEVAAVAVGQALTSCTPFEVGRDKKMPGSYYVGHIGVFMWQPRDVK